MKKYVIQDIRYNGQSALRIYLNHQIVWQLWDEIVVHCLGESESSMEGRGAFEMPTAVLSLGVSAEDSAGEGTIYYIPNFYFDGRAYSLLHANGLLDVSRDVNTKVSIALVSNSIAAITIGEAKYLVDAVSHPTTDIVGIVEVVSSRAGYGFETLNIREDAQGEAPWVRFIGGEGSLGSPTVEQAEGGAVFLGMTSEHLYFLSSAAGAISIFKAPYAIASDITIKEQVYGLMSREIKAQELIGNAPELVLFATGPASLAQLMSLSGEASSGTAGIGFYDTLDWMRLYARDFNWTKSDGVGILYRLEYLTGDSVTTVSAGEGRMLFPQDQTLFFAPGFGRAISKSEMAGLVRLRLALTRIFLTGAIPLTTENSMGAMSYWYQPYGDGELLDIYDSSINIARGGEVLKLVQTCTAVGDENNEILEVS